MSEPSTEQTSSIVPLLPTNWVANTGLPEFLGTVESHHGPLPTQIGPYRILRELGRGGMGVVYLARHATLGRIVALKMIHGNSQHSAKVRERFRNEAVAVARLQHPNIVQLYEIGEANGAPYCVLEYVAGGSLYALMAARAPTPRQSASVIELLARALDSAHRNGIVHRDIKPGNVLLAPAGGHDPTTMPTRPTSSGMLTPSTPFPSRAPGVIDGWGNVPFIPKLADFGLAKVLDTEGEPQTRTGEVLGTPQYMSPEQAMGNARGMGPHTDIWALGVILYEMLTGRVPFRGDSPVDTLIQIVHDDPVLPSKLKPKLSRDLETICLKCLEKQPNRRYDSALALADDLRAYLDGRPIQARPIPLWQSGIRWMKRHPTLTGLIAVSLLSVTSILVLVLRYNRHLADELLQTEAARATAITARDDARRASQDAQAARSIAEERRQVAERLNQELRVQFEQTQSERRRAETNFQNARNAVDEMLGVANQPWFRQVPHLDDVRRELLTRALTFQQSFLRQKQNDPAIQFEVARAQWQVAGIFAELGRIDEARHAYRETMQRLSQLLQADRANPEFEATLATVQMDFGKLLHLTGQATESLLELEQARRVQERLAAAHPKEPRYRHAWSRTLNELAAAQLKLGKLTLAEAFYRQAKELQTELVTDFGIHADFPKFVEDLAGTQNDLARVYRDLRRLDDADREFSQSSDRWQSLVQMAPKDPQVASKTAAVLNNRGTLALEQAMGLMGAARTERLDTAEVLFRRSQKIRERLAQENRSMPYHRHDLAMNWGNLAALFGMREQFQDAEQAYQRAVELEQRLCEEFHTIPTFPHLLASFHDNWANLLQRQPDRIADVGAHLDEAERLHRIVCEQNPRQVEFINFYRNHLRVRANFELNQGKYQPIPELASRFLNPVPNAIPAPPGDYFLAARMRLRGLWLLERDESVAVERRNEMRSQLLPQAIQELRTAIDRDGVPAVAIPEIENAEHFLPVRELADYAELRKRMVFSKEKPSPKSK
ncbi:protein kinase domain-containing protein [Tuwongella immobilis]|uniref:Protein kinase domain-containing protein n=1 Tax=Tuwongella immobilis TaxID=692036 RepID=A0A6C2YT87_9BACT|nr:protein kinase [Tuwongella immobilis]VIP04601.1 serine threonine protein kinase : Protein kinase family protein OS=Singulisphaera acidiphila (strain ATCC BAA-1392 / DSM 18658 / VKM B-2454 / MOB10) GN=Sinac_7050 PE=4 SV=1: Pkinase: TPR_1: TPR_10: TPR_1 [Tuwongella immobilis]VTS06563.1 serine threonine protein kinase : Protein kinase family protein OS=Singulisphaera acidiphila (strain ATCC BAA-1392 / DSM 18658 / VKM B-2454 / MOB10) GN=Sinac_7050 PE=4 SV=1: Pkinase: TPR_1: TPR_10: TPR_1 [Tuwongel